MKKVLVLVLSSLSLFGCDKQVSNYTEYDFLIDEPLLKNVLNDCISGKLNDKHTCNTVKGAYANLDNFKAGALDEDFLKMLGKK